MILLVDTYMPREAVLGVYLTIYSALCRGKKKYVSVATKMILVFKYILSDFVVLYSLQTEVI